jgi:ferric-dicitrate binding protein FerR (iron transport regulator)
MVNTPIGGQYQLILPDSTKVWLNAASSIRFPTVFTGSERRVEVTGEAYFQVRHMKAQSFVVQAGNQAIEDIGTGFNVNTYPDEGSIRTTLVEGAIKVNGELLKPDQQAVTATDGKTLLRNDIIVSDVIAWKNGQFRFKGADIEDLMRQAARWYNVQVEYKGKVNETFSGGISRKVNLSELLQILELTGTVEFEINGNKITVIPK